MPQKTIFKMVLSKIYLLDRCLYEYIRFFEPLFIIYSWLLLRAFDLLAPYNVSGQNFCNTLCTKKNRLQDCPPMEPLATNKYSNVKVIYTCYIYVQFGVSFLASAACKVHFCFPRKFRLL